LIRDTLFLGVEGEAESLSFKFVERERIGSLVLGSMRDSRSAKDLLVVLLCGEGYGKSSSCQGSSTASSDGVRMVECF
jgi:hypothetical protein